MLQLDLSGERCKSLFDLPQLLILGPGFLFKVTLLGLVFGFEAFIVLVFALE